MSLAPEGDPVTARLDMEPILEEGEDTADILKSVDALLERTQGMDGYEEEHPPNLELFSYDKENVEGISELELFVVIFRYIEHNDMVLDVLGI